VSAEPTVVRNRWVPSSGARPVVTDRWPRNRSRITHISMSGVVASGYRPSPSTKCNEPLQDYSGMGMPKHAPIGERRRKVRGGRRRQPGRPGLPVPVRQRTRRAGHKVGGKWTIVQPAAIIPVDAQGHERRAKDSKYDGGTSECRIVPSPPSAQLPRGGQGSGGAQQATSCAVPKPVA
jgi:hypothetical protein